MTNEQNKRMIEYFKQNHQPELLVQHTTCQKWQSSISAHEFDRVIAVRWGDSSTGYVIDYMKDKNEI